MNNLWKVWRVVGEEKYLNGAFPDFERAEAAKEKVIAFWGRGCKVEIEPPEGKELPGKKAKKKKESEPQEVQA